MQRWADAQTAQAYPLPCKTQRLAFAGATDLLRASGLADIDLEENSATDAFNPQHGLLLNVGPLLKGDILIPSYTQLSGRNYRFRFILAPQGAAPLALPPCPSRKTANGTSVPNNQSGATNKKKEQDNQPSSTAQINGCLDYFEITADLANCQLLLLLDYPAPLPAARYLLGYTVRPAQLQPAQSQQLPSQLPSTPALQAHAISQRTGPEAIRGAICSPTSIAMALQTMGQSVDWLQIVEACRDQASSMFGLWPLNLHVSSRLGRLGCIEAFCDWEEPSAVLHQGLPVVSSIRFSEDQLQGAPLTKTGGHLVLLHGVDGTKALVNDPAAQDNEGVAQRYDLRQFAQAWFTHRGAAYVFAANETNDK